MNDVDVHVNDVNPSENEQADSSSISLQAFQAAVAARTSSSTATIGSDTVKPKTETSETVLLVQPWIDGYGLRDLFIAKWGVPFDVDFQCGYSPSCVFVTILPVAFGNRRQCRHETELDYLMHLQAIIEILHRYDNLESWLYFLETTNLSPKPGIESVPYRLDLSPNDVQRIVGG